MTGPAATGKTFFIEKIIQPYLLSPTDIIAAGLNTSAFNSVTLEDISNDHQSQVLMCTSDNIIMNELTE